MEHLVPQMTAKGIHTCALPNIHVKDPPALGGQRTVEVSSMAALAKRTGIPCYIMVSKHENVAHCRGIG